MADEEDRLTTRDKSRNYVTGNGTSDPFWDVRIDIGGAAAAAAGYSSSADYIKHIFEDPNVLRDIIMSQMPVDERTGRKIYGWDDGQTTIEGIWILDHGGQYGNTNAVPGSSEFETIFTSIGKGLNANHGAGATINLRCCTGVVTDPWVLMESAAKWSGHAATAPLGSLLIQPLARIWADPWAGLPGYAPWACSDGFGMVGWNGVRCGYTGGIEIGQSTKRYITQGVLGGCVIKSLVPNRRTPTCVW